MVPEGWEWAPLSQLYNFIDYRGATPAKTSAGVPLVTAKNVKSGYIDYSIDEYISEEEYLSRQQRGVSRKGDILFTTEAPLGNVALANLEKFSAGQRLITFQQFGDTNELCNQLFVFFLLSEPFQHQLLTRKTGSTVAGIKAAILKTLIVPVPPREEQERISRKCLEMTDLIGCMETSGNEIQDVVSKAKAKILDLAIRGKLVPQNPDDEPASVLLERIRVEKEELVKQSKIKRDKRESIIFRGEDNSYYLKQGDHVEAIDYQYLFNLPDGWSWCLLSNIAHSELGKTLDQAKNTGNLYPYLRSVNIRWDGIDLSDLKQMRFEPEELERYTVRKGDLLICEGGDVGRSALWEGDETILYQNALHRVRFWGHINPRFIMYYMMYYESKGVIKGVCKGVTIKHLTGDVLNSIPFALPPLAEQTTIVAMIDRVFDILDGML